MTVLGFDYGEKRLGVAVGQTITHTATPLQTVAVRARQPDWAAITRLIADYEPRLLVVGMPGHDDGNEHALSRRVHAFRDELRRRYELPVELIDERLSSHEASGRSHDAGKGLDAIAAQVILETWMNENRAG